jgi:hypothetical protein
MVRTFLKVYMELGSYFLFLQEQIKDIIIFSCTGTNVLPCISLPRASIALFDAADELKGCLLQR